MANDNGATLQLDPSLSALLPQEPDTSQGAASQPGSVVPPDQTQPTDQTQPQPVQRDLTQEPRFIVHARHFGFPGDQNIDANTKAGKGGFGNNLEDGVTVGLTPDMEQRFNAKPGETFNFTDRSGQVHPFKFGARMDPQQRGAIDVYDPSGQIGELGQGTISRPGAQGDTIPALESNNLTIEKYPAAFGMRVATQDDVNNYDQYIQNGGDPNKIPVYDRMAISIAKDPDFLKRKENLDTFYSLVYKPMTQQASPVQFNDLIKNIGPSIVDTAQNLGAAAWNSANLVKDQAELAFRKTTGLTYDAGYQTLTSRVAKEVATQSQGIGLGVADAINLPIGILNGALQMSRPLAESFTKDPQQRDQLDRQFAEAMQQSVGAQQWFYKTGLQLQNQVANAYKLTGAYADVGQKIQTATPDERAVEGTRLVANPLNYIPELGAAGKATDVFRPMFLDATQRALEDAAGATARKTALDATQILPANVEKAATDPAYIAGRTVQADLAPATRAATADAAQKANALNERLTSLGKISGDPGTVTQLTSQALQAGGQGLEWVGERAEQVSQFPEWIGNKLSGGNPELAEAITTATKRTIFGGFLHHFGPVGGAIETALEHAPDVLDAVGGLMQTMGKEGLYADANIPYWTRVQAQNKWMPKFMASALDSPAIQVASAVAKGGAAAAATGAAIGGLQEAGTIPGGGTQGAIMGAVQGGILGMAGGGFSQWQRFAHPAQYLLQARSDWKRYLDQLSNTGEVRIPTPSVAQPARPAVPVPPRQGDIAARAYQISQAHPANDPTANWLQAERELTAQAQAAAVPPSPAPARQITLGSERQNFLQLSPTNQLMLAQAASHYPALKVNYISDAMGPNGFHFFDQGNRSNITVNLANQDSVIRTILAHELIHGATRDGTLPELYTSLFGDPKTGQKGQFTAVDSQGNPIGTNPATGRYYSDQNFNNLAAQYKNKMTQNGLPTAHLTDFSIAKEIYAEHGVDYLLSGAQILDSNSAFRPLFANKNAIKTAAARMGYTFDDNGRVVGAPGGPGGQVQGSGLFNDLQRNPQLQGLLRSHFQTTLRDGAINSEVQPTHRFTQNDLQKPQVTDTFLTNASEIVRNQDGTAKRDPLTGAPIYRTPAETRDYNANFTGAIRSGLQTLPEAERTALGMRQTTDEKGGVNTFLRYLPDSVLDSMAATNQYNPHQIASLKMLSRVLADAGNPGMEMRMFYNTALTAGKKYRGFEGKEVIAVPYGIELTHDNQLNIKSVNFDQLNENFQKASKRAGPIRDIWNGNTDSFVQDAHTYFTNHKEGRPGADGIGIQKRDAINALAGFGTQLHQESNPLVGTLPNSMRPIIKSYRIDRANQISATGAMRPFISEEQYYAMNRNYLPGAPEISYRPREQAPAEAAPPDTTAIPVTYHQTESGKTISDKIPYGITSAPLVSDKQPSGSLTENNYGHIDYLSGKAQKTLTALDKASAVTSYADRLVDDFQRIKDNPDIMAGKTWYKDVRKLLKKGFGKDDTLFAHLLAATSAGQGVMANWNDALIAYHRYQSGAFDDAIREYKRTGQITEAMKPTKADGTKFFTNSDEVLKVLAGTWLDEVQGPKTPNFFANLFGRGKDATIDKWAARTMRRLGHEGVEGAPEQWRLQPKSEQGVGDLDFAFSQQVFRQAAERVGMDPHELQAVMWFAEKDLWAKNGWSPKGSAAAEKSSYIPQLKAYAEHISAKPGFSPTTPEAFIAARNKTNRPQFLSDLKPEDLGQHQLFLDKSGTVGAAVDPNGDIQNVFNNSGIQGRGAHAVIHAIDNLGGRTLDAFTGHLDHYYAQFGFKETGRAKFDPAQAPANWNTKKNGTPDVVFMRHDGYPRGGQEYSRSGQEAALRRAWDKSQKSWIPMERAQ